MLCTIHYLEWDKKALDLSSVSECPTTPIDPKANIELKFLSNVHKEEKPKEKRQSMPLLAKRTGPKKSLLDIEMGETNKKVSLG